MKMDCEIVYTIKSFIDQMNDIYPDLSKFKIFKQ